MSIYYSLLLLFSYKIASFLIFQGFGGAFAPP